MTNANKALAVTCVFISTLMGMNLTNILEMGGVPTCLAITQTLARYVIAFIVLVRHGKNEKLVQL